MGIIDKIKALWAIKKAVDSLKEAKMKNGIQTTEFWLNLVSIVATAYGALGGFIPKELSMKVIAVLIVAYTVARSLVKIAEVIVKLTPSTKDDAIVDGVNAVLDKVEDTFSPKTIDKGSNIPIETPK